VILPQITRMLEQRRIPFEEVYAERGRVDEVFRALTLGPQPTTSSGMSA
jgi:hypothetical protein